MSLRRLSARSACLGVALGLIPSCRSTLDSVGCSERNNGFDGGTLLPAGGNLLPLLGPASYPNAFRDVLGKSDSDIAAKIANTFNQLFHGNPSTEAIFFTTGDQAYARDLFHNEIRTEGIGLGMVFSVQLDKREEFDELWRYAKSIQVQTGPAQGYFPSYCTGASETVEISCYDPFGIEQIATALLLARGRWQDAPGTIDYGQEASSLLDEIRNKEDYNCGVANGVTPPFDTKSKLPYDMPIAASANVSRPSVVMPAYYDLWRQATGDPFWSQAADAARAYWRASAHPTTGLVPERATFDGTPVTGSDTFVAECYRTFFNMTLDRVWSGSQPWMIDESNRVLRFFWEQGIATYGQSYSLDGTNEIYTVHDLSLVGANGALALIATNDNRSDFLDAVWNMETPTGSSRYYPSLLQLWSLLILSGQMRVY